MRLILLTRVGALRQQLADTPSLELRPGAGMKMHVESCSSVTLARFYMHPTAAYAVIFLSDTMARSTGTCRRPPRPASVPSGPPLRTFGVFCEPIGGVHEFVGYSYQEQTYWRWPTPSITSLPPSLGRELSRLQRNWHLEGCLSTRHPSNRP